ncbi:DUF6988 family protein [Colwellia polaris]|jgi:hypothetical protein|uniref:DUF6988 family protein n=1 Tax=Colwellia polaris TaxID=326537 RepID=UPI001E2A0AA5|nr:hypothetical protein [Colwellia polaris]|tara:strand:- start:2223 stop:2852 length:630 start_codon:yes stop_codon:yes gene_type:complete
MDKLLLRSSEFENYVLNVLSYPLYDNSQRVKVSRIMCSVSLEHAESFKILLASRNFTSAIGLLRLQFECLVRGMWILYVATDCAVSKLTAELNEKNQKRADNLPMLSEMIKRLEETAPKNAINPILEFKKYSWKPLSGYVHGGLHAVNRHSKGYPIEILEQALKASNGVNGMVAILGSILTGRQSLTKDVYNSFQTFSDCFQMRTNKNL